MTITAEQVYLLNNKFGALAHKVQLGTLIQNAESIVASEIALADGTVLIGTAGGLAASKSLSGAISITREGVATLGADAVTGADKIADGAISLEHFDSGVVPAFRTVAGGKFTTLGGDANEQVTGLTGVVATDLALVSLQDKGGTPRTILTAKPGTAVLDMVFSGDPSTDHVVSYLILRAVT